MCNFFTKLITFYPLVFQLLSKLQTKLFNSLNKIPVNKQMHVRKCIEMFFITENGEARRGRWRVDGGERRQGRTDGVQSNSPTNSLEGVIQNQLLLARHFPPDIRSPTGQHPWTDSFNLCGKILQLFVLFIHIMSFMIPNSLLNVVLTLQVNAKCWIYKAMVF